MGCTGSTGSARKYGAEAQGGGAEGGAWPSVVIVGAGFGGLACAQALAAKKHRVTITVVEPRDTFSIGGSWQYVWTGRATLEGCTWPISSFASAMPDVSFRASSVTSLDKAGRALTLSDGSVLSYDHLVLAPGVQSDPSPVPGLSGAATDLCSMGHVERMRTEINGFVEKCKGVKKGAAKPTLLVCISRLPYKCPPMPFEVAMLADDVLRRREAREGARLVLACPVAFPFGGPDYKAAFVDALTSKGIEYMPEKELEKVEGGSARFADGSAIAFDLLWATYPQRAPDFCAAAELTNPKGYVPVSIQTHRAEKAPDARLYCIGDAALAMMPAAGKPHPHAGEFALQQGEWVAELIYKDMCGRADPEPPSRVGKCVAETGARGGICVKPDLSGPVRDPASGMPKFLAPEVLKDTGEAHKAEWINGVLERFCSAHRFETQPDTFAQ